MPIQILDKAFDPWQEVQRFQQRHPDLRGKFGATSLFVGSMRDFNAGDDVFSMTLEHYPGMTEKQLNHIVAEAEQQWPILATLVTHRVGEVFPGEPIVLVAVWAAQRGDAFDANRHIVEALKSKAPFWKKERLSATAERWLSHNTDGYAKTTG